MKIYDLYSNYIDKPCPCGKTHQSPAGKYTVGEKASLSLPDILDANGFSSPFIVSDTGTEKACGKAVKAVLEGKNIKYTEFVFEESPVPDERAVGAVAMAFPPVCDVIIAVGSGVVNDVCKIISNVTKKKYIIIATAPSMDGYASATSSMEVGGLKKSLDSHPADIVIGDTDVLKNAPLSALQSGLGDMIAKYTSICEWRISNIVTGEYYCENIANTVLKSLEEVKNNLPALLSRDGKGAKAVFEGLIVSGLCMNFAGCSRPASGCEHYFSHIWDMRSLEFGTVNSTHGINCGAATLEVLKRYDRLKKLTPDVIKAKKEFDGFDVEKRKKDVVEFLGRGGKPLADFMDITPLYNEKEHEKRLESIVNNWDKILEIIEKMPSYDEVKALLTAAGAPISAKDLGHTEEETKKTFTFTRDIRNKYILSSLCFDLGVTDEINGD